MTVEPDAAFRRPLGADALKARLAPDVGRGDVEALMPSLRPFVRTTPVIRIDRAELGLAPGPLVLKLEHLQHAGSFKARGAFANMLLHDIPAPGVVAASGGNHGAAVAYAASHLGVPAFDSIPTVLGAGSLALAAHEPVDAPVGSIAIDSLAPPRVGVHTYAVIARLGAGALTVDDEAIRAAQELLWDRLRLVLEPGGCAALASILAGDDLLGPDETVAVVLSGANTTAVAFDR